jgi:hypothetical protein
MDLHEWPYRIKSARRKRRLVKKDRDKQLIKLSKKQSELWKQRWQLPMVPLRNPYQSGWKRLFVLRNDLRQTKTADFYRELLVKINTVRYHHDKSFKGKKRRRWKYGYEIKQQLLQGISLNDWQANRLKLSDQEKVCFTRVESTNIYSKNIQVNYLFTEPWRFVLKVMPHIITEVRLLDTVLEQEIDALDNHIGNHFYAPRINRLTCGKSYRWKDHFADHPKYINKLKNTPRYFNKQAYLELET